MDITITHRTEIIGGRGYPLTITRISGLQEVYIHGVRTWVSQITIHDCRDGCCVTYRRANEASPSCALSPGSVARLKKIAGQILAELPTA